MQYPCLDSEADVALKDPGNRASAQRLDGAAVLELRRSPDGTTALADLYQRAPCRVLFPRPQTGDPVLAVLLTTSGGLTGGDCTEVTIRAASGACATITTQAAEKIYRPLDADPDTRVRLDLQVGAHAWVEWLAQETILFDRARLRRAFSADVAVQGRLLALESIVLGRAAMGERFRSGLLHDAWRIRRDGRLLWADALHLSGDIARLRAEPFALGMHVAYSTLIYVGTDSDTHLEDVRRWLDDPACPANATVIDDVLLVRAMSADTHKLRVMMMRVVAGLRHAAGGWPARLPQVWHC